MQRNTVRANVRIIIDTDHIGLIARTSDHIYAISAQARSLTGRTKSFLRYCCPTRRQVQKAGWDGRTGWKIRCGRAPLY